MYKLSALAAALLLAGNVLAAAADAVAVHNPYVRQAPPGVQATAAFMVLQNDGGKDAKVLKADSPAALVTEMHQHSNAGGVMKMRPVAAIDIKAHGSATLQPGGLHLMLIDLKAPLQAGQTVPITLHFDDGSSKEVVATVVRPGALPAPMEHRH